MVDLLQAEVGVGQTDALQSEQSPGQTFSRDSREVGAEAEVPQSELFAGLDGPEEPVSPVVVQQVRAVQVDLLHAHQDLAEQFYWNSS